MIPFIQEVKRTSEIAHISNFSWRPGKLFEGANLQLSILVQKLGNSLPSVFTSNYLLWDSEARPELFSKVKYQYVTDERLTGAIPKVGYNEANNILFKIRMKQSEIASLFSRRSNNLVFYRRGGLYWKVFVDFETDSSEEKIIQVRPETDKFLVIAILSSNLWFWYLMTTSDCRHLGNRDINTFPFDEKTLSPQTKRKLENLGRIYAKDLKEKAEITERVYKNIKAVSCLSFRVKNSKNIIDEIDKILAEHYGFTEEELDFIINYDIKYRMGKELGGEDGEESTQSQLAFS